MLKITNLSKSYGKSEKKAVDGLNLHVRPGEIFGFIGPNGAGKTTTIKMITGILSPGEGKIEIAGHDIVEDSIAAKMNIGYVSDNHEVYDKLSGIEYINFMGDIYGVSAEDRKERSEKYAEMFELTDALRNPIKSYSHGMKQKLVIIAALLHDPKLWLLDEPLTGLDPRSAHLLKEQMHEHTSKGNSVFFSTHVLEVAEKLCDRVGIISKGKLIAVGTIDELKNAKEENSLESIFLELTEK